MADCDERRVPATDERCRGVRDELVVANGLDERVAVSGPVTVGRGRREPTASERYLRELGEDVDVLPFSELAQCPALDAEG